VGAKCVQELLDFKMDRGSAINKDVPLGERLSFNDEEGGTGCSSQLTGLNIVHLFACTTLQHGPARTRWPSIARTPTTSPSRPVHLLA